MHLAFGMVGMRRSEFGRGKHNAVISKPPHLWGSGGRKGSVAVRLNPSSLWDVSTWVTLGLFTLHVSSLHLKFHIILGPQR